MSAYPESDSQFEEIAIDSVTPAKDGWDITRKDHWSLWCPAFDGEPKPGSTLRIYGKGIGHAFRGLFVDGVKVFYRTEAEDADHREIELYGKDAADWLARWDAGKSVFSIEMGGMGPGYEQCCQIVGVEVVRFLLSEKPTNQDLLDNWESKWREAIDKALWANEDINKLGLSGAQAGAGKSLGCRIYMDGPRAVMNNPDIKDRHIQVSRDFPRLAA